jgi:hypothetical protein
MRQVLLRISGLACLLSVCFLPNVGHAASTGNRGLQISPLKQYIAMDAGTDKTGTFTIANLTTSPMAVEFSRKRFSVSDFAYNYKFSKPDKNWLALSIPSITLQPGQSKSIPFTITIPAGSAPGGYYYTFIASATARSEGVVSTVQATSLLFLTVNGKLITSSEVQKSWINHISYGTDISYAFDIKNTGNVHYFVYPAGHLMGWFTGKDTLGPAHVLLPGTIRTVNSTITPPLLPGIYRAEYSYRTSDNTMYTRHSYVAYLPLWSMAGVLLVVYGIYRVYGARRSRNRRRR